MSVHDELTSVQRCLDDLIRSVGRLEKQMGSGGLEMRRVRADANHLRESVALLRETAAATAAPEKNRARFIDSSPLVACRGELNSDDSSREPFPTVFVS